MTYRIEAWVQTGCCVLALDFETDNVVCDIFELLLGVIK